jgi:phosphoribosylformimino-5-aminoimidazole carboxamide ribotide isomerase
VSTVTVIPAIDILGGRCVRLVQGDYQTPTVYSDDPVEVAKRFAAAGAQRLHVVDLDAARGNGSNREVIDRVLRSAPLEMQVAGGVRNLGMVSSLIEQGAHWVIMGTAAVREPEVLEACARAHPGRVLAALDVRDNRPAVSGWQETAELTIADLTGQWDRLPIGGMILTCIDRDGTMSGPDLETLDNVRQMTDLYLQYSGGIASLDDMRYVAASGAQACILGKALYEGRVKLEEALAI